MAKDAVTQWSICLAATLAATGLVAACSHPEAKPARATPTGAYASVLLQDVPHIDQRPDFCGEAVAEMYMRSQGETFTQDDVFDVSGIDPARGIGVTTRELKTALERLGFDPGQVWYRAQRKTAEHDLNVQFSALHADLVRGVPSIVCTHFDDSPDTTEHFRLVLGYDADTDEVIYHDPAIHNGAYLRMERSRFLSLWPLKYDRDKWHVIRLRLDGENIASPGPRAAGFRPAQFSQHIMKLRQDLPAGFSVRVEPPFVVIGDGGAREVDRVARRTVGWAVRRLKEKYFAKDPNRILNIWLFKDQKSYESHNRSMFGSAPSTPFGYYSSSDGALVMNISTGGGTLVHEIVHPFIEANFASSPAWFNEGLASLYEQSGERDGQIIGKTNWRLSGLQTAIRSRGVPSFAKLTGTTDTEFYGDDSGVHYAQARYLLYYLQEHDLLDRYYKEFTTQHKSDPTGFRSLRRVLGVRDMSAFQKDWEAWVLKLKYRR